MTAFSRVSCGVARKSGQRRGTKIPDHVPMRDDQFLAWFLRLRSRLTRHLDALDRGELGAIDDVAAVLRTVACSGSGDGVLLRACRRFNRPIPSLMVGQDLETLPQTAIGFGALPVVMQKPVQMIDLTEISFVDWLNKPALAVSDVNRVQSSWSQLIADFANTYGAHLSSNVPAVLDRSRLLRAGGFTLGEYLIRAAGVAVEDCLTRVNDSIFGTTDIHYVHRPRRDTAVDRILLSWLNITLNPAGQPEFEWAMSAADPPDGTVILELPLGTQWGKIAVVTEHDAAAGEYSLTVNTNAPRPRWAAEEEAARFKAGPRR